MYKNIIILILTTFLSYFSSTKHTFAKKKMFNTNKSIERLDENEYLMNKEDETIFLKIKEKISDKNWKEAKKLKDEINDEGYRLAIETYILLNHFKSLFVMERSDIVDLIHFVKNNYFLDEFDYFNKRIEFYYLGGIIDFSDVSEYFNIFHTKDINVKIKLLKDEILNISKVEEYKTKNKLNAEIGNKIKNIWINDTFSDDEQEMFFNEFKEYINDDFIKERAEILVFKGRLNNLAKLIDIMSNNDHKQLFISILEIEDNPDSIRNIIKKIPKELRENEALLYSKLKYYRNIEKDKEAIDIIYNLEGQQKFGKFWYTYRNIYARELMKTKEYEKAYKIISSYNGPKNNDYIDILWFSGWLAYRYLGKYDIAFNHFYNMYKQVHYPISISRASYWLGRVSESKNKPKDALYWYNISSKYPFTFYGQLSHFNRYDLLGKKTDDDKKFMFPEEQIITKEDKENISKNRILKIALLYYNYEGKREQANKIFSELVTYLLKSKGEIAELVKIIEKLDDEKLIIPISKLASHKMVFFINNLFPTLRLVKKTDPNVALVHAIIKQESGFIVQAESSAGAIGFMQIIPPTAKVLCNELGITYNSYKLKHDPQYNIKLGNYYINQLIKKFDGSKILAIASYNAGPEATNRWIKDFGDPRKMAEMDDVVDWIESINYKETRNYVQRILENLVIYEQILGIE